MDNNNRNYTDYEPNFIMRDVPEPETNASIDDDIQFDPASEFYYEEPAPVNNTNTYTNTYTNDPRSHHKVDETFTNYDGGNFASWDNTSGYKASRKKRKKEKKPAQAVTMTRGKIAWLIIACMVVSTCFGYGGAMLAVDSPKPSVSLSTDKDSDAPKGYTLEDSTDSNLSIQEITAEAKNSVVEIKTESAVSDSWMQQYVTEGAGSGVIISKDGYIITNNHVIEGANKITVTTSAGEEYSAKLIGTDSNTDVAVIKINASKLDPATYGNSEQLHVGDLAVAIGNPLGELGGTVTAGIISALDRQLAIDGKSMTLLQTDSSINPGNSGGGLFNDDGHLIGIVVAKSSGSDVEGLGFAIPINTAAKVAQDLMDKGYVSGQPTTGMSYTEGSGHSNGDMDFFFGGYEDTSVYIHAVTGTNARKAGFKAGDMVYSVDGQEITCFDDLSSIVTSHKVGDKLKFTVLRNGEAIDITLELEEKTN
jgi:serine protease Do